MAEKKSNLVKLAKSSNEIKKKTTAVKKTTKVEKVLTPEEERDLKAKQKVNELLKDVDLVPKKESDTLLELDEEAKEDKGIDWLEEQLTALSDENAKLKSELEVAKGDYSKLFAEFQKSKQTGEVTLSNNDIDTPTKASLVKLFNEIQANHLALGRNFVIVPPAFLNRLVMFFPFLEGEKRF